MQIQLAPTDTLIVKEGFPVLPAALFALLPTHDVQVRDPRDPRQIRRVVAIKGHTVNGHRHYLVTLES